MCVGASFKSKPPRRPNRQLLEDKVVGKLDFKSRQLYDLLVQNPESKINWEVDMYHTEAFGESDACHLEINNIIDIIDLGRWLDVSVVKLYCM